MATRLARGLALAAVAVPLVAAQCDRSQTALTSECNGLCYEGRPCIAYAGDSGGSCAATEFSKCTNDTQCTYECFKNGPNDFVENDSVGFSTYTFLVPYGASESAYEQNWTDAKRAQADAMLGTANDTDEFPSKSNDVLRAIEPLTFLPVTTRVVIAGGSSVLGVRGKVAEMQLPEKFFASDPQLESVTLANLGLKQVLDGSFPSNLTNLTIVNCLMKSYPTDLTSMAGLVNLDFSQNYYAYYPNEFSLTQLQTLNMSTNSLTSFEGSFPNLVTLDLSANTLASIPATLFKMTKLKELYLRNNSFVDVELSEAQLAFLQGLDVLSIDSFGSAECGTGSSTQSTKVVIQGVSVCVSASGTENASDSSSSGNTQSSSSGGSSHVGVIVGAILGGIVAVGLLLLAFACCRRRQREDDSARKQTISLHAAPSTESDEYAWNSASNSTFAQDRELLAFRVHASDVLVISEGVARGKHRVVDLAKYRSSQLVAVKRLKHDDRDDLHLQDDFIAEIKLMAKLVHPRIVAFIGVIYSVEFGGQALYEYMDGGNLRSYLADLATRHVPRGWTVTKAQLAIDIAEALVYAHSFSPPLVHRDLKSEKVLLNHELRCKLGNLRVISSPDMTAVRRDMSTLKLSSHRSERWLAPEVISGNSDYDPSSDVFAFGVILSELDTHLMPYEDAYGSNGTGLSSFSEATILELVASGRLTPAFTGTIPKGLHELALQCLAYDPLARPSAVEVIYALRGVMQDLTEEQDAEDNKWII